MPLEEDCWEGMETEREKVVLQVASSLSICGRKNIAGSLGDVNLHLPLV